MKLSTEQIKKLTRGASDVISEDGKIKFLRFTEREMPYVNNPNLLYTAGIQLEFRTDGEILKLKINTTTITKCSFFCFDIFVNGKLIGCIRNINDEECIGNYAEKEYTVGTYEGEFELGKGDKTVRILFPHSVISDIINIEVTEPSYIEPVRKEKSLIVYGDSISQGFDAVHPSSAYAVRLADALDAELFNKTLGGGICNPELAIAGGDIDADYVVIAYGTNDWNTCERDVFVKNSDEFIKAISKNYPKAQIFVLSPIWRKSINDSKPFGSFSEVEKILVETCCRYERAIHIPGINLVPHDENLFGDLRIHPSDKGFEYYFENLMKNIKELTK